MPTGYTYPVAEKPDYTFEQFVWSCARAFGALIMMRDDPTDAPIPDEFKPSDTYAKWAEEARADVARLSAMTDEQAEIAAAEDYLKERSSRDEYMAKEAAQNDRCRAMRSKVADWKPPTSEHEGMKEFMLEQLDKSINYYVPEMPVSLPGVEWRARKLSEAQSRVIRMKRMDAEEVERTNGRNAWLKALRESVPYQPQQTQETS